MTPEELIEEYRILHRSVTSYGSGGGFHLPTILSLIANHKAVSVLDYGCGKGSLVKSLREILNSDKIIIDGYDPATGWELQQGKQYDVVVSTDVFEHFHPDCVDQELRKISFLTRKVGFFVVSTRKAVYKLPTTQEQCHTVVENSEWWRRKIQSIFQPSKLSVFQRKKNEVIFTVVV